MSLTLSEKLEALSRCWTPEFGELELNIHHTLTEPTCPTAVLRTEAQPDRSKGPVYIVRVDCDTIAEAFESCVNHAYRLLVEGKERVDTIPWTEPGEERIGEIVAAIKQQQAKWAEMDNSPED